MRRVSATNNERVSYYRHSVVKLQNDTTRVSMWRLVQIKNLYISHGMNGLLPMDCRESPDENKIKHNRIRIVKTMYKIKKFSNLIFFNYCYTQFCCKSIDKQDIAHDTLIRDAKNLFSDKNFTMFYYYIF